MAMVSSSMETYVDITDQRKLSMYLTANLPKVQMENPNELPHTYEPSWADRPLKITPEIFLDQEALPLVTEGLTVTWKRREGSGVESPLASGEAESAGVLTVDQNKLSSSASGMVTYLCYVSYYDYQTDYTATAVDEVSFSLVKNAVNARLVTIQGGQTFKYNASGELVGAQMISLTALVQGVTVTIWQYKNSAGSWLDYPATGDNTSITGETLVVRPAHAVFSNDIATLRVLTSDSSVTDTISITKLYDGMKGETGASGTTGAGGLSVIVGNEAQVLAATSTGLVSPAATVTIPFYGYEGTSQIACSCTVGVLPSGMTIKSNTAATATAAGSLVLSVSNNAALGSSETMTGTVDLTFTLGGKTVVKKFGWTKAPKGTTGAQGAAGQNAVVFSVYTPNGSVVQNGQGTLLLDTVAYDGAALIASGAAYQWAKYESGNWVTLAGGTGKSLTVNGGDIINVQSYRCTMTYKGKTYQDIVTVEDKTDSVVSEIMTTAGTVFKNGLGTTAVYAIVRANGKEVDPLLGGVSATAPANPTVGSFWYKIDNAAKKVTLMKYSGSAWTAASEKQSYTYTWYQLDSAGNATNFGKTGKVIFLSASEVEDKATLECEINDGK